MASDWTIGMYREELPTSAILLFSLSKRRQLIFFLILKKLFGFPRGY